MAKNLLQEVEDVIYHSQPIRKNVRINIVPWIKQWYENKKYFIQAFGGKAIYRFPEPVKITLSDREASGIFRDVITISKYQPYGDFIAQLTEEEFFNNKTKVDLEVEKDRFNKVIFPQLTQENNKTTVEEERVNKVVIPKNSKVLKALKYFIDDPQELREEQDRLSRYIQKKEITGYLHFSVHPLDFLSLSENAHGWTSCHSLDGDYAAGNISYMLDHSTFVCYITPEKKMNITNFPKPWYSKKWRVLLHMSNHGNFIFINKEYPFALANTPDLMLKAVSLIFHRRWNFDNKFLFQILSEQYKNQLKGTDYIVRGNYIDRLYDFLQTPKEKLFYNDITMGNKPRWLWAGYQTKDKVEMGANVLCPFCGKHYIKYSDVISCYHCLYNLDLTYNTNYTQCYSCGEYLHEEDAYTTQDHGIICGDCYEREYGYCRNCDGLYHRDNLNEDYLCEECERELAYER